MIDTTNLGSETTGDASAGTDNGFDGADSNYDGADSNPGFDNFGESTDNADLAFDAPGASVDLGEIVDRTPSRDDRGTGGGAENREHPYDTRLASNEDKPKLGLNSRIAIIAEIGQRLVRAFRTENYLYDLFNQERGTVSHTEFDGRDIFGSNSTSPTYTSQDRQEANQMREVLIDKYPEVMRTDNIGQRPNDAIYHAETNVLLRSTRENGGTLAGRSIEIYVDQQFCSSCQRVVPLVGLELGNPEITVIDPKRVFTIANGKVVSQRPR